MCSKTDRGGKNGQYQEWNRVSWQTVKTSGGRVWNCYYQVYRHIFDNLDDIYQLLKNKNYWLTQYGMDILNSLLMNQGNEFLIKQLPKKKLTGPYGFSGEFY